MADPQISGFVDVIKRSLKYYMPKISDQHVVIKYYRCGEDTYRYDIHFIVSYDELSIHMKKDDLMQGVPFNIIRHLSIYKTDRLGCIGYLMRLAGYPIILAEYREKKRLAKIDKKISKLNAKLDALAEMFQYAPGFGSKYLEAKDDFHAQASKNQ